MFNSCFGVVGYSLPYLVPYSVCMNMHNLPLLKLNIHMMEEVLANVNFFRIFRFSVMEALCA